MAHFASQLHQTIQEPDRSPASVFQGRVQEPPREHPESGIPFPDIPLHKQGWPRSQAP